ncbi:LysR family transcriptional regulator [Pseudomonas trivialis]|uniref:DNA-binding transcriptional regulator, LysR family n=1 Tax=Pseudomonas trivialis TaxID=200450 RepID=A0A0R2ZJW1_9PSED|nr:LysR family transcriptional regulator [Pseudomonas trivialis]KRP61285.1 LysR family transcriptional regulator [Pseudomonas trivialis]SDT01493.1 DNA-binding transcriptional regulator, LysR family [Pseudomonas trivialis]
MLADLPIAQIRHFLLVAEHGGFHAAAGKACRTQPAISKSVQALEDRLGGMLLEPGRRSVLTPLGRECLPYLRELVSHHDRTAIAMSAFVRKDCGALTIAAIAAAAANWLPQRVAEYQRDFPGVAIRLLDDNSRNVERMVLAAQVDFGIGSTVSDKPHIVFEPLMDDLFGLVCSRNHPLATCQQLRWSALEGLPLLGTTAHRQLEAWPQQAKWLQRPVLQVDTMLTLLALLDANVGVTVLAKKGIPTMLAERLAFVPLVHPRRVRRFGILRLAGQSLSPAAQAMVDRLHLHANAMIDPVS